MKSLYAVFMLISLFTVAALAQPNPDTLWTRTYGGSRADFAYSVQQTSDGGYVAAGYTYSFGAGSSDFYLVKTNSQGGALWTRTYGGNDNDWAYAVQQTEDGGYILAGMTNSFGAGQRDFYLVKTNSQGDTLWTRTYGGYSDDWASSVQQTDDGGYILAGSSFSFGTGPSDFYLVKTNNQGDTLWTRTYGRNGSDFAYSVQQTADGGYIIAGSSLSIGTGYNDIYVVKTNSLGDTLWTRVYGGSDDDFANSVQQTTDGGYIVAGSTYPFGADESDFYVIKTNSQGDTLWTRTYGGSNADDANSVQQTADGGYIVAGRTLSFGAGNNDFYVVRTNSQGDTLWTRTYGGNSDDFAYSVQQTADGGYIVAGSTYSFGAGEWDFYVVKTGPDNLSHLSGPLSGTLGPGTFHIVGDISVQGSNTLTLMPGTVFTFDSLYEFHINGTLLANGTASDSIVFTTDTVANPIRWRGIRFDGSGSSGSQMTYCIVENGHRTGGMPNNYGGGVYCTSSSPTFTHCVIRDNNAQKGGGVYCTNSSPIFTNCAFSGNSVTNHGGGVFCEDSSPTFTSCLFENNQANYGGGASCYSSTGSFTGCTISSNSTGNDGGGVFCNSSALNFTDCVIRDNVGGDNGGGVHCQNSSPSITHCTISGNSATGCGGAMCCENSSSPHLTDCDIQDNSSSGSGGGVFCSTSSPDFTECTISGNSAEAGGGVYCVASSPSLDHCTISNNTSNFEAGGLNCSTTSSPTITHCTITGNVSNLQGGALYCRDDSSPTITDCIIRGNSAHSNGGALYCYDASPNFIACTLSDNSSNYGGGIYCVAASPILTSCTISQNSAGIQWGGVYCSSSSMTFNSTIIAFSYGEGVRFQNSAGSQFKYCDIFGNSAGNIVFDNNDPSQGPPGIGQLVTTNANDDSSDVFFNICLNPMFVDTATSDYHLVAGSPCIDAGDPILPHDPDGTVADIGAFFFSQGSPPSPFSLLSPQWGDTCWTLDTTLVWEVAVDFDTQDTVRYAVWLDTLSDFSTAWEVTSTLLNTSYYLEQLTDDHAYYWTVRATDLDMHVTWASDTLMFRTYYPESPQEFALAEPPNDAMVGTQTPTLRWRKAVDPDPNDVIRYHLMWSYDSGFSAHEDTTVSDTSFAFPPGFLLAKGFAHGNMESPSRVLRPTEDNRAGCKQPTPRTGLDEVEDDSTVYWKVEATDRFGFSASCMPQNGWNFHVYVYELPSAFSLLSPADSSLVSASVTCCWQVSHDPDPGDTVTYTLRVTTINNSYTYETDTDTCWMLDLVEMGLVDENLIVEWWVEAHSNYPDITMESTSHFHFYPPSATSTEDILLPKEFALHQNYPNPFNPMTAIRYDVPVTSEVRMIIVNLLGQRVATLVNERQLAGTHIVLWDATDWPSGVYLCRMEASGFVQTRKMVLVK